MAPQSRTQPQNSTMAPSPPGTNTPSWVLEVENASKFETRNQPWRATFENQQNKENGAFIDTTLIQTHVALG